MKFQTTLKWGQSSNVFRVATLALGSLLFAAACNTSSFQPVAAQDDAKKKTETNNKPGQIKLHRKAVVDPAKGNLQSHTIYVPEGWKMDGVTRWPHPRFFRMLPSPQISVSSPDGFTATIHHTALFSDPRPSIAYQNAYGIRRPPENSSDGGSFVKYRPDSFREWKALFRDVIIPEQHPDAKSIRVKKVSEIEQFSSVLKKRSQALFEQVNMTNQQSRSFGLAELQSIEVQGLMIEAEFEQDGQVNEFVALLGLHSIETQIQGLTQIRWSVEPNVSYIGPKGNLEPKLPLLSAITGSMRPTKSWMREVQRYVAMNTPRGVPASNSSQSKLANTYSDILDISHKGFRARSSMGDASQSKYINSVHETNPYSYGGTSYQLPAGYDHVYTDNFDTIILTNDSLFDPRVEMKGSGTWHKMSER